LARQASEATSTATSAIITKYAGLGMSITATSASAAGRG
jgi:hypothetical protein